MQIILNIIFFNDILKMMSDCKYCNILFILLLIVLIIFIIFLLFNLNDSNKSIFNDKLKNIMKSFNKNKKINDDEEDKELKNTITNEVQNRTYKKLRKYNNTIVSDKYLPPVPL